MTRSTPLSSRRLHHIVRSPNLLRKILGPLEGAIRDSVSLDKERSWFPKFPVLAHLLCGIFFQICQHRSLRELVTVITAQQKRLRLSGFVLRRSTFSDANNSFRRLDVIRNVFASLVRRSDMLTTRSLGKYARLAALDSSLLRCVPSATWASYRKEVNACKAHLSIDLANSIPKKLILTEGRVHDRQVFEEFLMPGWTYIVDRAYNDYDLFDRMTRKTIYFVTRLKSNASWSTVRRCSVARKHRKEGVLRDSIIQLGSEQTELRLVEFEADEGKVYQFLTNRFDLSPLTVAQLYRARWAIEKFFKWLKRTLVMERALAYSEVGMEIHVLMTLITDILLKLLTGVPNNYRHIPVEALRLIRENLSAACSPSTLAAIQQIVDGSG
jgi:hypothetical protein